MEDSVLGHSRGNGLGGPLRRSQADSPFSREEKKELTLPYHQNAARRTKQKEKG